MAYSEGPMAGVKKAAAIVTNPTHLAIAIQYEKEVDAAPYIVAKGEDIIAERIIKLLRKMMCLSSAILNLPIGFGTTVKFMILFRRYL